MYVLYFEHTFVSSSIRRIWIRTLIPPAAAMARHSCASSRLPVFVPVDREQCNSSSSFKNCLTDDSQFVGDYVQDTRHEAVTVLGEAEASKCSPEAQPRHGL